MAFQLKDLSVFNLVICDINDCAIRSRRKVTESKESKSFKLVHFLMNDQGRRIWRGSRFHNPGTPSEGAWNPLRRREKGNMPEVFFALEN